MMKTLLVSLLLASSGAMAQHIGFSAGSDYKSVQLRGEVQVFCSAPTGGSDRIHSFCRTDILEPYDYDYFVGPKVDADEVSLKAFRADGSTRSKSSKYDGQKGVSKSRFNLWIASLFQKPLLNSGKNVVEYQLTKSDRAVTSGQFTVYVNNGGSRQCRPQTYYETSVPCGNAAAYCDRYFSDQNYCR